MASNTIIPCTSSSSHVLMRTYDVFVSFRGEDTRYNFTGFLFEALHRKGIDVFKDDKHLKKGESIAPELLQAIQGSRIFVVVFSKDYASSTWCLRELAQICNCIETSPRRVLPVCYDVDPSEVRKQSRYYKKAFAKHEERFKKDKVNMKEVQSWREALTRVANRSGLDMRNKPQYVIIDEIVQMITNILGPKYSCLPNDHLVGIDSRVKELAKLLHPGSTNDVRVVGISGMSGIGKTTLVRAFCERISHLFDFCCFIDDVSQTYRNSGALGVQKQLLSQSLNEKKLEIYNASEGTQLVWTRLRNARGLVVFDNVDQIKQLKMFTGNRETLLRECLGGGSKIIIISRDDQILRTNGVDDIYKVMPLNPKDAIQLFCKNAFKGNYIVTNYEELTRDLLSHAQGHPLAIQVLGSSLFGRNVSQWRSALARIRENKTKNIMNVLRISFDELDDTDKEIFLDIACFFNGHYEEQYVKEILDFRGFHPEYGLQVLVDKSLITIEERCILMHDLVTYNVGRCILMHDLLSDLGKCLVREKSPKEPRKWSRLWDYQDFHKVMLDNKVAQNLEAIVVHSHTRQSQETTRGADALSKMRNLKLLRLTGVNFSGRLNFLSNKLGYLTWSKYPFDCLPSRFEPDKLVELVLCHSSIKQLWEGTKALHNLRHLDLSHSKNLVEMPNVEEAIKLEVLILEGCIQLRQIDASIGFLRKLVVLNLRNCKNLVSLPNSILCLNSLEYLSLSGCLKLYSNRLLDEPREAEALKKICIGEAPGPSQSSSSFVKRWLLWPFHLLYSGAHKDYLSCLFPSSPHFLRMRELDLSFCNLVQIPDAIGNLNFLERLNLMGNNFATLPKLNELYRLYYLNLQHCKKLKYLPELPSQTDSSETYKHPWSIIKHSSDKAGLYIFNSPKLVESERERITSMTISWMIQIFKADRQYHRLRCPLFLQPFESIIPGSEIPSWFTIQHDFLMANVFQWLDHQTRDMYTSINIFTRRVKDDNNWIGLVFCAIIVVHHERRYSYGRDLPYEKIAGSLIVPVFLDGDLVTDESEHMWLFYFTRSHSDNLGIFWDSMYPSNLRTFEFAVANMDFHVEIKKYGYRWVYEQDLYLT